jgi:small subunit ribosomal protein S3
MGQKVLPTGLRIGINERWRSRWYADKRNFGKLLWEDQQIRRFIAQQCKMAAVSKIEIERTREELRLILHTARPGMIIGRKGQEVDKLRDEVATITGRQVSINIREIQRPEFDAQLVAQAVAEQLERRASFRRTLKRAVDTTMERGGLGIKIVISGRLGGSEMSRTEKAGAGSVPLSTLRAKMGYGFAEAKTNYGNIGVKVWIFLGEATEVEDEDDASDAEKGKAPKGAKGKGPR